jgi:CubicO group peptidase (beta-lactamase class C family)
VLLAHIVEAITAEPYRRFVQQRFFDPAGMVASFVGEPAPGLKVPSPVFQQASSCARERQRLRLWLDSRRIRRQPARFHGGDNDAYRSLHVWWPEDDLRLVVLTNSQLTSHEDIHELAHRVRRTF